MKFSCEPRFCALLAMLVLAADAHARRGVIAGDAMSDPGVSNQSAIETMNPDVEELTGEVRHQLVKQEAAMTSVHLSFEQRRIPVDVDHPAAVVSIAVGFEQNHIFAKRHTVLLDQQGPEATQDIERAFDGSFVYTGDPRQTGRRTEAVLQKFSAFDKADPLGAIMLMFDFPYMDAAGYYVPRYIGDLKNFAHVQPMVLRYLEESQSTRVEKIGDKLRVTTLISIPLYKTANTNLLGRVVSFLLDPKHGYAVSEREESAAKNGKLILRTQSEDWKYFKAPDLWLPRRCVVSYYADPFKLDEFGDDPLFSTTETLNNVEFGHQNLPFDLMTADECKVPGTMVIDRTVPEALGRIDHRVVSTIFQHGKRMHGTAKGVKTGRLFLVTLLVISVLPPAVFFFWRFKKR